MQGFTIILDKIIFLSILMLIGYLSIRFKYIETDVKNAVSKVILKLTLPFLIVTSLTKLDITPELITNAGIIVGITFVVAFLLFVLGYSIGKMLKMPKTTLVIHCVMSAFGNVIFLAYPLIQALYGDKGLFYAACYAFANDILVWTFGVYSLSTAGNEEKTKGAWKNIINPATIAFVVSIIMMTFRVKFPPLIQETFSAIGATTTFLSMLFIGGTLALIDIRQIYKRFSIVFIVFFKMLIAPIVLIFIFRFLPIDAIVKGVIILQVAMPSQTIVAILSQEYKTDTTYAAEVIFITTIVSVLSLTFIYYLMEAVLKI